MVFNSSDPILILMLLYNIDSNDANYHDEDVYDDDYRDYDERRTKEGIRTTNI